MAVIPRIPNISIVYLLVVITLASTRGRYAAIFAAVTAFLAFDFFIVPPVFTFVMYRVEEWIALFVFLVDALVTGQLASALRQRAKEAATREAEMRYTPPESPIEVAVQVRGNEVHISVADRGPGIPVEDLEHAFDKFYRILSDRHYTGSSLAGSGLGLAICKGLVEAHGGHIWARSRDGGGVVFWVALPIGRLEGSFA